MPWTGDPTRGNPWREVPVLVETVVPDEEADDD
jgi:hypothetical protein